MPAVHRQRPGQRATPEPTPEAIVLTRRQWLAAAGLAGAGLCSPLRLLAAPPPASAPARSDPFQAPRNRRYRPGRPITPWRIATHYNNFYEFDPSSKTTIARLAQRLTTRPWTIEITGLLRKPRTIDVDDLLRRFPLEERVYRFRCVEAWSMVVPWVGFELNRLIRWAEPLGSAKYVRFVSFLRPDEAPGQRNRAFPWPYYEALRMDEAMHELTLLVLGMYGRPLPKQNGAPLRVIVPWKYGYKSPKSIVRIEFTETRPRTFWNDLAPDEYSFLSNVDPKVPHPRWSQATERVLGTDERVATLPYNGYAEQVARLYH